MTSQAEIVAAARGWIGTPFQHQARLRGVGVDCIGVVIGVAHELAISDYDITGYGAAPYAGLVMQEAERHLERVPAEAMRAGDVLLLRIENDPQHFGIVAEVPLGPDLPRFVHAFSKVGRCVETALDRFWRARVVGVYRFRGL